MKLRRYENTKIGRRTLIRDRNPIVWVLTGVLPGKSDRGFGETGG